MNPYYIISQILNPQFNRNSSLSATALPFLKQQSLWKLLLPYEPLLLEQILEASTAVMIIRRVGLQGPLQQLKHFHKTINCNCWSHSCIYNCFHNCSCKFCVCFFLQLPSPVMTGDKTNSAKKSAREMCICSTVT